MVSGLAKLLLASIIRIFYNKYTEICSSYSDILARNSVQQNIVSLVDLFQTFSEINLLTTVLCIVEYVLVDIADSHGVKFLQNTFKLKHNSYHSTNKCTIVHLLVEWLQS